LQRRDGFRCHYCGRAPHKDNTIVLHVDHIHPRILGGSDDKDNLITSCEDCNIGKGSLSHSNEIKEYFGEKEFRNKYSTDSGGKIKLCQIA
jgi:5-methylcytosine-specific restriction endonuclease McrA